MNLRKCKLITLNESTDISNFPGEIERIKNFVLLGSPVGTKEFCSNYCLNYVRKLENLMNEITSLGDSHISFLLLKYCGSFSKVVHLIRTVPSHFIESAMKLFDLDIRKSFEKIIACYLSDESWEQATLGPKWVV